MRHVSFLVGLTATAALASGVCPAAETEGASEPAVWQHHQELINYFGITAAYTCTGIEDKVRQVLRDFGARKDLKVVPLCSNPLAPMRQVFVRVDFYSLAPSSAGAESSVPGQWIDLRISPSDALFRDRGDCELYEHLKDVLTKDFTVRDLKYDTSCTPHETTLQDYKVTGQVLAPPRARRGG